ncbi:MAG: C40 family peptidase, partial [Christensenellales bacterium]
IYHCLSANSIDVPKTDCEGYAALKGYKRIEDMDDLERGDVLFFEITVSDRRTVWHGGVYMGDGEMVDASSAADKVVQRRMRTDYWERYFSHALRFE